MTFLHVLQGPPLQGEGWVGMGFTAKHQSKTPGCTHPHPGPPLEGEGVNTRARVKGVNSRARVKGVNPRAAVMRAVRGDLGSVRSTCVRSTCVRAACVARRVSGPCMCDPASWSEAHSRSGPNQPEQDQPEQDQPEQEWQSPTGMRLLLRQSCSRPSRPCRYRRPPSQPLQSPPLQGEGWVGMGCPPAITARNAQPPPRPALSPAGCARRTSAAPACTRTPNSAVSAPSGSRSGNRPDAWARCG